MAGNEQEVTKYIFRNKGTLSLSHLGVIQSIGVPSNNPSEPIAEISSEKDVNALLSTQDARKKADIYLNGIGVSVKQGGGSFSFNRLQRCKLLETFQLLKFNNPQGIVNNLDREVLAFHQGGLDTRNRPWCDFFKEEEFKSLTRYLMMEGSPSYGASKYPAELILEAPSSNISQQNISVFTFEEYFHNYIERFTIAIRRQWVGQSSNSEHRRALGLTNIPENGPWIFDNVVGEPRTGWRSSIPVSDRKTVYFLMIEKK